MTPTPAPTVIVVSVGNTSTKMGIVENGVLADSASVPNDPAEDLRRVLMQMVEPRSGVPVALASVNDAVADGIQSFLQDFRIEVLRLGRDLPVHLQHSLDDDSTLGQDRILNAIGAFAKARQACIVIDAGTAVTVDFVDGEGVFHGGAIAPGVRMMLDSLHGRTAALPRLDFAPADPARGPFGKDTRHAMQLGVTAAVQGLAHLLIDRYAQFYEAYPRVIATGGDARALFAEDELVETIIPELPLLGLAEICRRALADDVELGAEEDQ